MLKKVKILIILFVLIILTVLTVYIIKNNKYSKNSIMNLIKNSTIPSNIYIENNIYENDLNSSLGFAKFYIKDNKEYIYQENKNHEKIEVFVNSEDHTLIVVLHSEKIITQTNNIDSDSDFNSVLQPLKNTLLNELNDSLHYQYKYCGKELVNGINCIKISLTNIENNENYNYYIEESTGYIVQYEFIDSNNSKQIETYSYNINSVTDEQLKIFNLDNYSNYTFVNSI